MKKHNLQGSTILITGGTGSWGRELAKQLLNKYQPKQVRVYSRGEHKQVMMRQQFNNDPRLKFIIGDVRDKNILNFAMRGVDFVFHLAALKHVPVCEENNWEAVLTNIYGTQNVIETAIANNIKRVIDISTDKAVDPLNLYGVTKACGEKMIANANINYNYNGDLATSFMCIRGGNVLGTTGSVIPLFKKQIKERNEITVTDPTMTRFLMSVEEAIGLIFTAVENALGGEIFVMRMPATTVEVIAKIMVESFGNPETKIKVIGVRPGEKMHEVLVSRNEAVKTKIWSDQYYVILPQYRLAELEKHYQAYSDLGLSEFTSANTTMLKEDEFRQMIKAKAEWLFDDKIDYTT